MIDRDPGEYSNENLLAELNEELSSRNLKPLKHLGVNAGEWQVLGISDVYDRLKQFCTQVVFRCLRPGDDPGQVREYVVDYHANSSESEGLIVLTKINGKLAVVRQYRLPLQAWTYEVCRSFGQHLSGVPRDDVKRALACVRDELGVEVIEAAKVVGYRYLGDVPNDTGRSAMSPEYWLLELEVPEKILASRVNKPVNGLTLFLWNSGRVGKECGRKLRDLHSLAAITLLDILKLRSP